MGFDYSWGIIAEAIREESGRACETINNASHYILLFRPDNRNMGWEWERFVNCELFT